MTTPPCVEKETPKPEQNCSKLIQVDATGGKQVSLDPGWFSSFDLQLRHVFRVEIEHGFRARNTNDVRGSDACLVAAGCQEHFL